MPHHQQHMSHYRRTGFWGRRAAGCLFLARSTARLCFALRSRHALQPLTYGTWGGAMDGAESPLAAVRRETIEEAGVDLNEARFTPLYVFRQDDVFEYHNFVVETDDEFSPVLNWENAGFVWADFEDWPQPLHPGVASLLSDRDSLKETSRIIQDLSVPAARDK